MFVYFNILILTVLDVLFTTLGLEMGVIEEANPLMNAFYKLSPILTITGVLLFISVVLYLLYKLKDRFRWIPAVLYGIVGIKVFVLLLHVRWIMAVL